MMTQDVRRSSLSPGIVQLSTMSRPIRTTSQVPNSTGSIAGLITEQRHRRWIQQYLSGAHTQPT
jgi:hypothetical protein